jgi:hypothetical protein
MGMMVASLHARRFPESNVVDVRGVEQVSFISDGSVQEKDDKSAWAFGIPNRSVRYFDSHINSVS